MSVNMLFLDPVPILPNDQVNAITDLWELFLWYFAKFYNLVSDNLSLQLLCLVGIVSAAVEIVIFFQNRGDKE